MSRPRRIPAVPGWVVPGWVVPAIASFYFLIAGLAFIPYPGLQNDELFFAGPLNYANLAFYAIKIRPFQIPLMVMSYSGALKTWIYAALFQFLEPGPWSVRIPVVLMGAGTIWLTWIWTRRLAGARAAAIATLLLATDTIFLLTDTFDWGPVALQHLLLMGGLVAISRWMSTGSGRMLAVGFFLWGLGMWDKALLIWPVVGLTAACLLVYPKETFRRVSTRAAFVAIGCFLLGALPLVIFNLDRRGETATSNAILTTAEFRGKAEVLRQTIDGSALFGYIVYGSADNARRAPQNRRERLSVAISNRAGSYRKNWMLPAWIAGLICFLALLRTAAWRPLLFLLIASAVTWLQMAFTRGAGSAAHHAILLWPFPPVFLGIAFSGVADRIPRLGKPLLAAAIGILIWANVLNANEYLAAFVTNGAPGGWTDAIYPLAASVENTTASWIGLIDWGYLNGLGLLHEGDLPLFVVNPDADAAEIRRVTGSSDFLFIQHTEDKQIFPGVNDRFRKAAEAQGYVERVERVIHDRNGRSVFELFRFQPKG